MQLWRHTGPHLNENEAWNQENGDVHVYDFEPRYLKNQLAYEGQWWLVLLDISCSFIWAQLVLNPEFPFKVIFPHEPKVEGVFSQCMESLSLLFLRNFFRKLFSMKFNFVCRIKWLSSDRASVCPSTHPSDLPTRKCSFKGALVRPTWKLLQSENMKLLITQ